MIIKVKMTNHATFLVALLFQFNLSDFWKHCTSKAFFSQTRLWYPQLTLNLGSACWWQCYRKSADSWVENKVRWKLKHNQTRWLSRSQLQMAFISFYILSNDPVEMSLSIQVLRTKKDTTMLSDVTADKLEIVFSMQIFVSERRQLVGCLSHR